MDATGKIESVYMCFMCITMDSSTEKKRIIIRKKKSTDISQQVSENVSQEIPVNTLVATSLPAKSRLKQSSKKVKEDSSEKEKMTCTICLESFNKIANTEIKCCFCEKSACRRCIQTFLTSTTNDPHCMHCSKVWERDFIDDNLTMTYRTNEYKKHRENILLDREIALMPSTQARAEQMKSAEKIKKEIIYPIDVQLKELYTQLVDVKAKIMNLHALRNNAHYKIRLLTTGKEEKVTSESTFIRKCPDPECRGFLSTACKCGLCSKWACPECHELKGENRDSEHTCKPDNIETVKLLAKDSRPCPGCATIITKIEGCDQMWCPQCHTPFSWRTGQKETGVVHNPHFYEWQRKQNNGVAPRVAGDIQCGGIPYYNDLVNRLTGLQPIVSKLIMQFHRVLQHTQHVEIAGRHNVFNEADNEDLRIQYLLGEIGADKLKYEVQAREKKREKERAVRRALEVLVQAGTDILQRIMAGANGEEKLRTFEELDSLRIYVNELLSKIHTRMKLSVHQYKSDWVTHNPFTEAGRKKEASIQEQLRQRKLRDEERYRIARADVN